MIQQDLEIVFNKKTVSETYLIGLRSEEIVSRARPGQFVMIRVRRGTDPLLRRPFSICGTRSTDLFLVLYRVVGQGTAILAEAKAGQRLSVLGPLGQGFRAPKGNTMPLLVAGGIGVAPLLFLAQDMKPRPFYFMTGFNSSRQIIAADLIDGVPIEVSIATDDGTAGHAGPVTDLLEAHLRQDGNKKEALSVFACGPGAMLKKVAAIAMDRGIAFQASLEAAMACGLGACQGCAVKAPPHEKRAFYHVCKDGPVFPGRAIDWDSL